MRAKKLLLMASFLVMILSLLGFVICMIFNKTHTGVYDFFMAIFSGAIVGVIMSLIEYFAERESAMLEFHKQAEKVLDALRYFERYDSRYPFELIYECFLSLKNNAGDYEKETPAKQNFVEYLKQHERRQTDIEKFLQNLNDDSDSELLNKYHIDSLYKKDMEGVRAELIHYAIMYYELFDKLSQTEILNAFDDLDFLFIERKIKKITEDRILVTYNNMVDKLSWTKPIHWALEGLSLDNLSWSGTWPYLADEIHELNEWFHQTITPQIGDPYKVNIIDRELAESLKAFRERIYNRRDRA